MLEEHEACYKDNDILKKVNDLTDLFDDVILYIHNKYDYCEFFADVFYTKTEDVGTGIIEQLIKYTEMFLYEKERNDCIEKNKNDKCVCEYKCSGQLSTLLKKTFDLDVYDGKILKDKRINDLLTELANNIGYSIGVSDGVLYELQKKPNLFKEFYPLVFIAHLIRCGNYTFLIMYGTSE